MKKLKTVLLPATLIPSPASGVGDKPVALLSSILVHGMMVGGAWIWSSQQPAPSGDTQPPGESGWDARVHMAKAETSETWLKKMIKSSQPEQSPPKPEKFPALVVRVNGPALPVTPLELQPTRFHPGVESLETPTLKTPARKSSAPRKSGSVSSVNRPAKPGPAVIAKPTGKLIAPRPIVSPRPAYPAIAEQRGIEGRVILVATISTKGRVSSLHIRKSAGNTSLDQAARDAVRRWKFSPAKRGNTPVAAELTIPIDFRL